MYKRVLLLVSVQRCEWEARGRARGRVGGEEGMLGPGSGSLHWGGGRGRQWDVVTSGSCVNPERRRAVLELFLSLPLAKRVWWQLAVSKFVLNGFGGGAKAVFKREEREGCEGPSLTSSSP